MPKAVGVEEQTATEEKALEFLKRYLRLTHCDLFFADAAILVEGASEKLLLPSMIDEVAKRLRTSYLTVLEIGGAYAHRFDELLSFLCIPNLVITDLDSVSPEGRHPSCRADQTGALTSNATLKQLLNRTTIAELRSLSPAQKFDKTKGRYVTYQIDVQVTDADLTMCPRTFEESIAYQNFALLRNGDLNIGVDIPTQLEEAHEAIYEQIGSSNFKKTDFAMSLLASSTNWQPPNYIVEGLKWLETRLHGGAVKG